MERKLATVRIITDIRPIEGADKIELASVGGWNVVVAKDVGHKVNDMVIYCEIDSFLPIREEFEFLRKSSYKKMGDQEGFRLKTIKLRGQVSQGLILPIHVLPLGEMVHEGQDVTEMLGIVKYEPPIPAELAGKVKGQFPSFLQKTDEERVQNLVNEYEKYKLTSSHQFYVTEKLDGSSSTFYIIKGQRVMFFNAFDIDKHQRMTMPQFLELMESLELQHVPCLELPFLLPSTVEGMLKYAEGTSVLNRQTEREGVVVRSYDNKISFKAISNKFLLEEK